MTKKELYEKVEDIRNVLDIKLSDYPIFIEKFIENTTTIEKVPFSTHGIRGLAFTGNAAKPCIILNANLSSSESNFYCGHEVIHMLLHPSKSHTTFTCYDSIRQNQNGFMEWQANEGSAELLMPYRIVIPEYVDLKMKASLGFWPYDGDVFDVLADRYHLTHTVCYNRISSLSYEIQQFERGVPLDTLQILSKAALRAAGISVQDEAQIAHLIFLRYDFMPIHQYAVPAV